MKPFLLLSAAALGLLLCSCVQHTPQTRIADHPAAFASLSTEHQDLVSKGLINKGMPQTGVLLALGTPNRETNGFRDGSSYTRWDYTSLRPVYSSSFFGSYYHGCGYHHGYGFGYAPTVHYIPQREASVWFRRGRVDAWDRIRSPHGY